MPHPEKPFWRLSNTFHIECLYSPHQLIGHPAHSVWVVEHRLSINVYIAGHQLVAASPHYYIFSPRVSIMNPADVLSQSCSCRTVLTGTLPLVWCKYQSSLVRGYLPPTKMAAANGDYAMNAARLWLLEWRRHIVTVDIRELIYFLLKKILCLVSLNVKY